METLTSERVQELVVDCLFRDEELADGKPINIDEAVVVQGITVSFGFNKARLEAHRAKVADLCNQLHSNFHKSGGGGWSFLQIPFDKNDKQWGEQKDAEELYVLASGLGMAEPVVKNRGLWNMFPGGVPYIVFDTTEKELAA